MVTIFNLVILGQISKDILGFIIIFLMSPFLILIIKKMSTYLDKEKEKYSEDKSDKNRTENPDIIKPSEDNEKSCRDGRHDDSR